MVSFLTAHIIQTNYVGVITYQNKESGKWGWEAGRFEVGNYRPLLHYNSVYDSKGEAMAAGVDRVISIRRIDLEERAKLMSGTERVNDLKNVAGTTRPVK
jgi:curli biogenesis system outer membrane secretion channel CsgG